MSSQQQQIVNVVAAQRVSHKLVLDSEEEQKREQQQQKILEQIQKKKQQKRQRRQQAQRLQKQKLKIQQEKQKVYEKPQKMFEEDSDDGYQYKRVVKKIKRIFPQLAEKYDHYGKYKKNEFIINDADDDQEQSSSDDSDSNQQSQNSHKKIDKKKKQQRKQSERKQKRHQKKTEKIQKKHVEKYNQSVVKKQKIKIQPKTTSQKKQNLVKEVSVRWWYALPEWPPADFDYKGKLKQLGYRIVDFVQWKTQNDVIDGLQKALAIDGYRGVYKTKTKIIDVRPKQAAPTLNNFRSKSIQQLTSILKKALQVQIEQLKSVKYEQQGEKQLLSDLQRQLIKLK